MSELHDELEPIRARAARFTELQQGGGKDFSALDAAAYQSQSDVPRLLELAQGRRIETPEEVAALDFGTVLASPNYMDAMSVVPGTPYRGESHGYWLMNVATTNKAQLATYPDFLPAYVVYSSSWAKQ